MIHTEWCVGGEKGPCNCRAAELEKMLKAKARVQGWCSDEKAAGLFRAVSSRTIVPRYVVEIGVFGGQSLLALAAGVSDGKGMKSGFEARAHVWGIDPWSSARSLEYEVDAKNREYWGQVDHDVLYAKLLQVLAEEELLHRVSLLRMTSRRAARLFDEQSISLLHIDGNHNPVSSCFDAVTWIPKVCVGGEVWFDDIDWHQTQAALELVRLQCREVETIGTCARFIREG